MNTSSQPAPVLARYPMLNWLPLALGLGLLYLPSFYDLFHGAWSSDKNAHGPIVLVVSMFYLYMRIKQLMQQDLFARAPAPAPGIALLALGLVMYALGRSQSVLLLEVGSLVPVLSGVTVLFFGLRTWSRMWFAFFFMLFMIPLPASVVDTLTLPLKIGVSYAAEHLLYWMGYPIARSGVILTMGPYQLLVADACAGLNSLFTLEALGLLYMNLVRHPSLLRNLVLATLIVPISFAANTIRIIVLALITYYMGDAAGQGFLHGFSGMVLFLSALSLIIAVDSFLSWIVERTGGPTRQPSVKRDLDGRWQPLLAVSVRPGLAILAATVITFTAAQQLVPVILAQSNPLPLAQSLPPSFGDWREVQGVAQAELATADDGGKSIDQPYDDVLMRTYVNSAGVQMMVALATSREQRQDVKIHLPEVCYPAQGYKVLNMTPTTFAVGPGGSTVPGKHLLTEGQNRLEAVSYWVRISDSYPQGGLAMRMKIFRDGLAGKLADGILVRASMVVRNESEAAQAYATQQKFLAEMVRVVDARAPALVAAAPATTSVH